MKRIFLLLFFSVMCCMASAQGPTVTVVNNTGYTINYLHISSNNTKSWESDVLGRQVLENGKTFRITLPESGVYDFRAIDKDNDDYFKWNLMVRGNTTITFTMADYSYDESSSSSVTTTSSSNTRVTVVNDTGYTIYYLYISRQASDKWEEDVLGDEVLLNGKEVRVTLPGPGVWDFKVVDKDSDDYYKYGVSIDQGSANRVVFRISDLSTD